MFCENSVLFQLDMQNIKKFYSISFQVEQKDIDEFNHVNNEVYLTWLLRAATEHSNQLGYSLEKYVSDGAAFVVRRHELDYLAPAFLAEELVLETWVSDMAGIKSTREYQILRQKDRKIILKAKTLWVYVSLQTGKPVAIPETLIQAFQSPHE